jgi:glycosyltransferase involved in cell wall biosynthesis
MLQVMPHTIIHMHLDDRELWCNNVLTDAGTYYIVFWWRQVPLGDLYVKDFKPSELLKTIQGKLEDQLNFYKANPCLVKSAVDAFQSGNLITFTSAMDQILGPYLPADLPKTVNISIVVCTRNRSVQLRKCLQSLLKQICAPAQIIVVDNAPLDEETKKVTESFEQVIYHKEPRLGLDIARNTGAKIANHAIVAYTDDDVLVDPLWSYRVWQSFLNTEVGALTGLVIAASLETESQLIFEEHWGFNKGYRDIYFGHEFLRQGAPGVWVIGAGANMAFRKTLLESVGYFDERLDVGAAGCSGDSEIWYRILAAGFTIQYNPRAVVYHEHRREMTALHKQLFNYMRGFAAAALIQHGHNPKAGYKRHLFISMPRYYLLLLRVGFPTYRFRYRTLWSEIKGLTSGVRFYYRHKNSPSSSKSNFYGRA